MPTLLAATLVLLTTAMNSIAAEPGVESSNEPDVSQSDSDRCKKITLSMNYRDVLRTMQRAPDSTLHGHTAAWNGEPPGSFAIDFWNETTADGTRLTSSLRYRNGVVTDIDCGQPDLLAED